MPRTERVLQALVSSPGDVAEERNALEEVVRELNLTWSKSLGIRIEPIRWETHTFPDFGVEPQAVVNRQIPEDYDIFIGIMWVRFGTPTDRAGSGTEEEFIRAYERYKNGDLLHLMIYVKNQPKPPLDIEPEQFARVRQFVTALPEKGGLYSTFGSLDEFQTQVRIHLSRVIQEFNRRPVPASVDLGPVPEVGISDGSQVEARATAGEPDEPGFLDLVEMAVDAYQKLGDTQAHMTEALAALAERSAQGAIDLRRLHSEAPQNLSASKRIIGTTAEEMENFVARMSVEIPIFSDALQAALNATGQVATLAAEVWPNATEQANALLAKVVGFHTSMSGARGAAQGLREMIAGTPRMTTQLNRARRKTVAVLDKLLEEFAAGERLAVQVEELVGNFSRGEPE